MVLALVRDLRELQEPPGAEEIEAFETDVLAGFVLARASAGLVDSTIRNDTGHLDLIREWLGRPLREMQPGDLRVRVQVLQDRAEPPAGAHQLLPGAPGEAEVQTAQVIQEGAQVVEGPDRKAASPARALLTVADAAAELGLAPSTLHRWLGDGFIKGEQLTPGAPWRIRLTPEIRALFVDDAPDGWLAMLEATLAYGVTRQTIMQRVNDGRLHGANDNDTGYSSDFAVRHWPLGCRRTSVANRTYRRSAHGQQVSTCSVYDFKDAGGPRT